MRSGRLESFCRVVLVAVIALGVLGSTRAAHANVCVTAVTTPYRETLSSIVWEIHAGGAMACDDVETAMAISVEVQRFVGSWVDVSQHGVGAEGFTDSVETFTEATAYCVNDFITMRSFGVGITSSAAGDQGTSSSMVFGCVL